MTKLKSASDWAIERVKDDNPNLFELFIAEIQQNAIEAALELASENATIEVIQNNEGTKDIVGVSKQSITSLINHPNLKV